MKTPISLRAALALVSALQAAPCAAQAAGQDGPRLVVLISVDQLRADLVERYAPAFSGGFRRFLDEGYRFTEASHAHANTETAVGHATLSTGVFPSRSGIVANNWSIKDGDGWRDMYAVEDSGSPILGQPEMEGRSPRNLLRPGLADWVLAADPEARVASISGKDRAAITLAGQTRSQVYWIAPSAGRFVTSTYYRDAYPDWVERFNREVMPQLLADTVWNDEVPEAQRGLARTDAAPYEGDGTHTAFPHLASQETTAEGRVAWLLARPFSDRAVARFAREAIDRLRLGQRGHVDMLALSFSSTDYVGHAYGPLSQEQLDNLVRLDHELGTLFDYLDERVGRGRWVTALSADHGVLTMPEYLAASGEGAERIDPRARIGALRKAVEDASAEGGEPPEVRRRIARLVEERGLVAGAYTEEDLTRVQAPDSFAVLFRNSYYPGRAGGYLSTYGIEIRFGYHDLVSGPTGTSHGTPYWNDRHVPFMLLGANVGSGASDTAVYTVDVAPTLAGLAGVSVPDDLDGRAVHR